MDGTLHQTEQRQDEFFSRVHSPLQLLALIDHLPATYFFAKDKQGFFVHVNRAQLDMLGLQEQAEVLGKTDHDFFVPEVADRYQNEDQQVMATGKALVDQVCVVPDATGVLRWYVETKIPLFDREGQAIGVAGILRDLEKAGAALAPYQRLGDAISHISNHYAEKIVVDRLASLVHLSVSQFNRTFKKLFKISPAQYITRVRINAACSMLQANSDSIETIANRTGFCDASHFVRQFKKIMRLTPRDFRKQCMDCVSQSKKISM